MSLMTRRSLLVLAASSVVLAGCAPVGPPLKPVATPTPPSPGDWSALAGTLTGKLATPGSTTYDQVRLTQNPRWDAARPLAVLSAASAADVARGLAFAARHAVPLALRSGGHSYPGYSSGGAPTTGMPPSMVIDSRAMNRVVVNSDNTVTVGAGASLALVYSELGAQGRAIAGGSCATVGIAGLTLGGGVGVLTRAFGLTCDALREVEIVTADGVVRTASSTQNSDLFWACRGGGGGHLGVVTSLTFATKPAPEVTMFSLSWPFAAAAAVIEAFQEWIVKADRQAWGTLKLLNGANYSSGPGVFLSGTWIGPTSELAGVIAPLVAASPPKTNTAVTHTYAQAMAIYSGCRDIPVAECTTDPGGKLTRESFAATSHIAYKPLDPAGIAVLLEQVEAVKNLRGVREAGVSLDALGGAVADVAPTASAFPHRAAIMSVQYTATFADSTAPGPFDAYVRGFRAALTPALGASAYVNYADSSLQNPSLSYFGSNAGRLATVRAKFDPAHLFSQPQGY